MGWATNYYLFWMDDKDLSSKRIFSFLMFIKIASENPFLWTGMKDASAESRK